MEQSSPKQTAGKVLKRLIQENYSSQEDFAYDYGLELRTVSRYVNEGINKIDLIQQLAGFFGVSFYYFFEESNS